MQKLKELKELNQKAKVLKQIEKIYLLTYYVTGRCVRKK